MVRANWVDLDMGFYRLLMAEVVCNGASLLIIRHIGIQSIKVSRYLISLYSTLIGVVPISPH